MREVWPGNPNVKLISREVLICKAGDDWVHQRSMHRDSGTLHYYEIREKRRNCESVKEESAKEMYCPGIQKKKKKRKKIHQEHRLTNYVKMLLQSQVR